MDGYVENLTNSQSTALQQFRRNLADVIEPRHNDAYLLRWLRARRFSLQKSEAMLKESLSWRRTFGADALLKWTPPGVLLKYYPGDLRGYDRAGRPIFICPIGQVDQHGVYSSVKKSEIVKYCIWQCERIQASAQAQSLKLNRRVERFVILLDMQDFCFRHLTRSVIETYSQVLSLFEANYPECIETCYIVNTSRIFPILYNIFKPFLSEDTKKKIKILGSDWKEKLLHTIEASELPVHWGGTATDPDGDPWCRSQVCLGGPIPESYYMSQRSTSDLTQYTTVTVGRRSCLRLDYPVKAGGAVLRWEFVTESSDIGFSVVHSEDDPHIISAESTTVVIADRVDSHLGLESGSVICDKPGTYTVVFDNSYSWTRSKKLSYFIDVFSNSDHAKVAPRR